jgi:phage shock protein E
VRAAAMVVALVLGLALVAGACSSGGSADPSATAPATGTAIKVGPEAFARRVADPRVVTINVHTPNAGNIAGTDLAIPYDQIKSSTQLPADRSTPLAVYCRSGNMSAPAVRDLQALGYRDIVELAGGYDAWLATGSTLVAS